MADKKSYDVCDKLAILGALEVACQKFETCLYGNHTVLDYLMNQRHLTDTTISKFRVGYAPDVWNFLSNEKFVEEQGYSYQVLDNAGLIKRPEKGGGYYDRLRGRITIPVFNSEGRVIGFTARLFGKSEEEEKNLGKYFNTPETTVYKKGKTLLGFNFSRPEIMREGRAIVIEGAFDHMMADQNDILNTVSPCGTGLTKDHLELLKKGFKNCEIVLVNDGDEGGRASAQRLCTDYLGYGIKVALLPEGMDPDVYLIKNDPEKFRKLIEKSQSGLSFIVDRLSKGKSPGAEDKARIVQYLKNPFASLPHELNRLYVEELSSLLSLTRTALEDILNPSPQTLAEDADSFYSSDISEQIYTRAENSTFWQSQLIRVLVSLSTHRNNQNNGLEDMLAHCEEFKVRDLLTMPEARAVYDCIKNGIRKLPLTQLGTDLFGQSAGSEMLNLAKKYTKKELDDYTLLDFFNVSKLAHPVGKALGLNHSMFERAVMELKISQIRQNLRIGFRKKKFSLKSLTHLAEKVVKGEINGDKKTT